MDAVECRTYPCRQCPWRQDSDLAEFADADFAKLAAADGGSGFGAPRAAPMMSCHLDQPGTEHAMRLCAGWLATVGPNHLAVRIHVLAGQIPSDALAVRPNWPRLHANLTDMLARRPQCQHGNVVSDQPGEMRSILD